jgi:hypothetical protein
VPRAADILHADADRRPDDSGLGGLLTDHRVWSDDDFQRLLDVGPGPQAAASTTGVVMPARIGSHVVSPTSEPIPPESGFVTPEPASAILLTFGIFLTSRRFRQHL